MTDNNKFVREVRYAVIKLKKLNSDQRAALSNMLVEHDIPTVECVVVESNWPEYDLVWRMIEDRVTST